MTTKAVEKTKDFWPTVFDSNIIDRMFNAPIDEFFNMENVLRVPAINVNENGNEFRLTVAAPGLEKSDFNIQMIDNMLTISAEKEHQEKELQNGGRYNRREYNYSSWSRSFTMPENCKADKIEANYENGELLIVIPKIEKGENKTVKSITVK
jgi:HSP20 family protein